MHSTSSLAASFCFAEFSPMAVGMMALPCGRFTMPEHPALWPSAQPAHSIPSSRRRPGSISQPARAPTWWIPAFAGTTIKKERGGSPCRLGAPGEEAVVLEPELAIGERLAVETEDMAAGGFEHRLASGSIPFHRRAETRIEVGLCRREHAEFEGAAAFQAFEHRLVLKIFGEAAAVLMAAAVHDNDALGRGHARPDRCEGAATAAHHRRAGAMRDI